MPESSKKKFNYGALVAPILAIGVILYYTLSNPDVKNLGSAIAHFNPTYLIGTLLCVLIYVCSEAAILQTGCNLFPGEMNYLHSIRASLIGFYYSALTPFSSGGQPMQVAYMRRWKVPTSASSSIMVISFYFWHICYGIISIIAFIVYRSMLVTSIGLLIVCIIGILISLACVLGATLIMFNVDFRPLILFFVRLLKKIKVVINEEKVDHAVNKWIDDFKEAFVILKKYPLDMMKMLLFSATKIFGYLLITYVLYKGFGLSGMSFLSLLLLQALVNSAVAFIPTPGASGASEGVFFILFGAIFTDGTALPAMLIWRGFTYYMFLFVGAFMNIIDGVNDFRLRLKKNKPNEDFLPD